MSISKRISPTAATFAVLATLSNLSIPFCTGRKNPVASNLSDLPYDENFHLASHILAYPASGPCASLIEAEINNGIPLYGHVPIAVEGDAATAIFGDRLSALSDDAQITDVTQCPAVCLDRGVDSSLVAFPMPQYFYNPKEDQEHASFAGFISSLSCGRVEFGFINYSPKPLSLYWMNTSTGHKTYMYPLERLEKNTRFIHTFVGHRFLAEDPESGEVLLDHVVEFNGVIGIGNHVNVHRHRDVRDAVRGTMQGEWLKHLQVKRTFRYVSVRISF